MLSTLRTKGGDGRAWNRGNGWTTDVRGPRTWKLDFAPWSGLLLNPRAADIVKSQDSGYFFGWDDYLACWRLTHTGIQIWACRER